MIAAPALDGMEPGRFFLSQIGRKLGLRLPRRSTRRLPFGGRIAFPIMRHCALPTATGAT